jgi:hypothetical protein
MRLQNGTVVMMNEKELLTRHRPSLSGLYTRGLITARNLLLNGSQILLGVADWLVGPFPPPNKC